MKSVRRSIHPPGRVNGFRGVSGQIQPMNSTRAPQATAAGDPHHPRHFTNSSPPPITKRTKPRCSSRTRSTPIRYHIADSLEQPGDERNERQTVKTFSVALGSMAG